jgi:hypothetical protein
VSRQVVEDHDITLGQGRGELSLDIGLEDPAVHRPIHHEGSSQAVTAQARDEGLGEPVAEQRLGVKTPALEARARAAGSFWS